MKKESLGQCNGRVWHPGRFRSSPCQCRGSVARDGVPYCGTHDPVRIKERTEARNKKWDEKWAERQRGWDKAKRVREAHEPMLNALKVMVEITTNPGTTLSQIAEAIVKAREAIAKAENG